MKVGVYICYCGSNIAATVDVEKVAEYARELEGVYVSRTNKYTCSDPGQETIRHDICELGVDRVVVAACSPRMHERTFRGTLQAVGLNPYFLEMANLREHCSWVHSDVPTATEKAKDLIRAAVERVRQHEPLQPRQEPVTRAALVVGGGIAGIQAALDIANAGYQLGNTLGLEFPELVQFFGDICVVGGRCILQVSSGFSVFLHQLEDFIEHARTGSLRVKAAGLLQAE